MPFVSKKSSPTLLIGTEEGLTSFNNFYTKVSDTTGHQMTAQFPT